MECTVENLNPTRKKITVTLSGDEVDSAINAELTAYRKDLSLPGFRRGKVPTSVIERRFGEEVLARATQQKVNKALDEALREQNIEPLSNSEYGGDNAFKRGQDFTCTLTFDVLPDIDFPVYEGLSVEQAKAEVTEEDINAVIEKLRERMATSVPTDEKRLPADGDTVDVDFDGFENDTPIQDVTGRHFVINVGENQVLPDFEALVKSIEPGDKGEGPVAFPADYAHEGLAGKTITMKITVNSINRRELPEVDDEFAKKVGLDSLEKLNDSIREHELETKKNEAKGAAIKTLLEGLIEGVEIPLPEGLLKSRVARFLENNKASGEKAEPTQEEQETAQKEAEHDLRPEVFLMALGKKEKIEVTDQEVDMHIYSMAVRARQDYQQVRDIYQRTGLIHELRDRILADKAMDYVYSKAQVTEV